MIGTFNDAAEIHQNYFAKSPLGKKLEGINFDSFDGDLDSTLDSYVNDIPNDFFDDNGIQYRTEYGELVTNNTYVLNEITYKTDDNGIAYSVDGKLQSDCTYELNGNLYTTDENGRIVLCTSRPVLSPENLRDNEAQRQAGGEDRRINDQGGHIIGRDLNGDGGIGNLIAMDSKINQSDYKRMENDIKDALREGKEVVVNIKLSYSGDSERPDVINAMINVDGKKSIYMYDNNVDGALDKEVQCKSPLAEELMNKYSDSHVSSVKQEYDQNEKMVKTIAYITYSDDTGATMRKTVIIPNN